MNLERVVNLINLNDCVFCAQFVNVYIRVKNVDIKVEEKVWTVAPFIL